MGARLTSAYASSLAQMFPLEEVQLPDTWDEMVPWAADGLRAMQRVLDAREGATDPRHSDLPAG